MLKITGQQGVALHVVSIVLEGRLAGPWVEELRAYCREILVNQCRCAMIDLSGVTFIDAGGRALLTCLWQEGAELRATGCLTRCVVEEITGVRRAEATAQETD